MIGKISSLGRSFFGGRFGRGVFWNLIGTALGQGSVFLAAVILGRILGKEVFGEFGIVQSTLLTMTSIAQVATGITANKYVAEFRDIDKERTGRILGLCSVMTVATGILAGVILLVAAPFLAEEVLGSSRLTLALSIGVVYVFFSVINGYQIGTLSGLESYRSIAVYGAFLGIGHVIVCALGALYWGLFGALAGISLSAFLRWLIYSLVTHREIANRGIQIRRREALGERDALFKFALPAALAGLTTMPALWLGNAFLVRQPGGFAEMGLYSAGLNLRTVILFVPLILNNVAVSLINSHKGRKDESSYQSFFTLNLKITFLLAFVGASAMWFFGEIALRMFGSDFTGDYVHLMVSIMAISIVFEAVGIAVYQVIQSHEKMWQSFFLIAMPRDLAFVFAAFYLTQTYGGAGLAGAFLVGCSLALAVKITLAYKLGLHKNI